MPSKGRNKAKARRRTKKTSKGIHGGGGNVTLTPLQRILIRGDRRPTRRFTDDGKPLKQTPWKGVRTVAEPYDPTQAELNKQLYPHLFVED